MFIFSNCLIELFNSLVSELEKVSSERLLRATIVVPNESIRSYVQYELVKRGESLLRLQIVVAYECFSVESSLWTLLLTSFFEEHKEAFTAIQDAYAAAKLWRVPLVSRFMTGSNVCDRRESEKMWDLFVRWCSQKIERTKLQAEGVVFAFGFSSLSPALLHQLLQAKIQQFFVLSPCMLFWVDQSSDVEAYRLLGMFRQLATRDGVFKGIEDLILDRQELLANCGILGREFLSLLIEMGGDIEGRYVLPEELHSFPYTDYLHMDVRKKESRASALDHIRADMLLLLGSKGEMRELPSDRSIEIYGAPTPLHEVYALRKRIEAMGRLDPAAVVILCTQLERYRSCIEEVFGGDVPYQIWGEPSKNGAIATFDSIVQMCLTSAASFDWKQIVRQPVVQRALGLDDDGTLEVLNYLTSKPSVWGLSEEYQHRYNVNRCLPTDGDSEADFEEEKRCLIDSFIRPNRLDSEHRSMEASSSIAIFLAAIAALNASMSLPLEVHRSYAVSEILPLLKAIFEIFCAGDGPEERAVMSALTAFSRIVQEIGDPTLPFQEIRKIFFLTVRREFVKKGHRIQSPIIVAEFGEFQAFPAPLIAILGAGEDYLPKSDDDRLIGKLHLAAGKAVCSNIFFEKYHFIETLLCAENLFIGYQNYSFENRDRLLPSCPVASLLQHIEAAYKPKQKICFSVPLKDRLVDERKRRPAGLTALNGISKQKTSAVEVGALFYGSRSLLQRYYEDRFSLCPEHFSKDSIFIPNYSIQRHMSSSLGQRTKHASKAVQREIVHLTQKLKACLSYIGIPSLSVVDVHLLPFLEEPSSLYEEKKYVVPSVCVRNLSLYGTLEGHVLEGLILTSDKWHKELFARWCEYVLRSHLACHRNIPFENAAIAVFECQRIAIPTEVSLEHCIDLYLEALQRPFPFTYEIVELLLREAAPGEVYNAIVEHGATFSPPHPWHVFSSSVRLQEVEDSCPVWRKFAKNVYGALFSMQEQA